MDQPITRTSEFSVLTVFRESINEDNPDLSEDEIYQILESYAEFLDELKSRYNFFRYTIDNESIDVIFKKSFPELRLYLDMMTEILSYLTENNIPWSLNDLSFQFSNSTVGGLIQFDQEKQLIKVYYLDSEYKDLVIKKKIPFGLKNKL